jgi:hypothetical protein
MAIFFACSKMKKGHFLLHGNVHCGYSLVDSKLIYLLSTWKNVWVSSTIHPNMFKWKKNYFVSWIMLFQYEKDIPWYKSKINLNLFSCIKYFQWISAIIIYKENARKHGFKLLLGHLDCLWYMGSMVIMKIRGLHAFAFI